MVARWLVARFPGGEMIGYQLFMRLCYCLRATLIQDTIRKEVLEFLNVHCVMICRSFVCRHWLETRRASSSFILCY